jgi:hypothetical protein
MYTFYFLRKLIYYIIYYPPFCKIKDHRDGIKLVELKRKRFSFLYNKNT